MKTSVALCTYNGEKYLKAQLDSILQQTVMVDEIVVCDDCSADATWDILENYQSKYPEVFRIFKNSEVLKVVKNFEKAINLCSKEIIFLCDQDDKWFPEKVEKLIDFFEKTPDRQAVFHNLQLLRDNISSEITMWDYLSFNPARTVTEKQLYHHLIVMGNLATGAALAMRKQQDPVSFVDISDYLLHDYQLALRFSGFGELGIFRHCLGYYQVHDAQQVGASIEPSKYLVSLNKLYYSTTDIPAKLRHLDKIKSYWKATPHQNSENILKEIELIINSTKKDFLRTTSFLKKKEYLLKWYLKKRFNTSLKEVFLR